MQRGIRERALQHLSRAWRGSLTVFLPGPSSKVSSTCCRAPSWEQALNVYFWKIFKTLARTEGSCRTTLLTQVAINTQSFLCVGKIAPGSHWAHHSLPMCKSFLRVFAYSWCTASHIPTSPLDYLQWPTQGVTCANSLDITLSSGKCQEEKFVCVQYKYDLGRIFPACIGWVPV